MHAPRIPPSSTQNEAPIREALAASGLPRGSVFLTSKVSPYEQGAGRARQAVEGILERLGTDYVVREAGVRGVWGFEGWGLGV
mgnify:CR=1 FL=1